MKFRCLVAKKNDQNREPWWEEHDYEIGEQRSVRGYGKQPKFTGDIEKFGRELVEWFNAGCRSEDGHRVHIRAEPVVATEEPGPNRRARR